VRRVVRPGQVDLSRRGGGGHEIGGGGRRGKRGGIGDIGIAAVAVHVGGADAIEILRARRQAGVVERCRVLRGRANLRPAGRSIRGAFDDEAGFVRRVVTPGQVDLRGRGGRRDKIGRRGGRVLRLRYRRGQLEIEADVAAGRVRLVDLNRDL